MSAVCAVLVCRVCVVCLPACRVCVMCLRAGVQVWVLDTRFMMWGEAKTLGKPPQARISHTFTLVSSAEEAAGTAGYDVPLPSTWPTVVAHVHALLAQGCGSEPVSLVWPRLCH